MSELSALPRTAYRTQAIVSGVLFFAFWLLVLLAGADFPPPRGFVVVAALDAVCAWIVYWRVPAYIAWMHTRRPDRYARVAVDGLIAGLMVALIVMLLPGGGEPNVTPTVVDRLIWFAVLGTVGLANSVAVYGVNALYVRYSSRVRGVSS